MIKTHFRLQLFGPLQPDSTIANIYQNYFSKYLFDVNKLYV